MAFRVVGLVSASLPKYLNSKVQLLTSVNLTSSANEQLQFQTASQPNSREDVKSPNFSEATFKGMQSHFPCLTKLREKETSVSNRGLEGMYGEKLQGYKTFKHQKPFRMKFGGELPELQIAYEEWGELNEERNNTILIHTGLSGSSHAKSSHSNSSNGWWEKFIGPGAPIDTNKFYVVCSNVLGGCYGSSGPSSYNPVTGEEYGTTFPLVSVEDMVAAQFLLLDYLGVDEVNCSIGSSLGGMQAQIAAANYSERVKKTISISSCAQSHPSSIAMRYIQRRIIMADPNWKNGHYYGQTFPVVGMQHARELGTISYRSGPEWDMRFGNKRANSSKTPDFCPDFLIETYLDKQGEKFCTSYDPNSLLYISKAMDLFDMGDGYSSLVEGLSRVKCPILVMGVTTDILFPIHQQRELARLLKAAGNNNVVYYELDSIFGHDTFLIDIDNVGSAIREFLANS